MRIRRVDFQDCFFVGGGRYKIEVPSLRRKYYLVNFQSKFILSLTGCSENTWATPSLWWLWLNRRKKKMTQHFETEQVGETFLTHVQAFDELGNPVELTPEGQLPPFVQTPEDRGETLQ